MIGEPQIRKRTVRDLAVRNLAVRDLGICKERFDEGQGGECVAGCTLPATILYNRFKHLGPL